MNRTPSPVIFYKAALCPRCLLVTKVLARLRRAYPELVVVEIDAVRSPVLVWREGYKARIGDKFYTAPQQRKPLTDEQMMDHCPHYGPSPARDEWISGFRACERAHGIGDGHE